MMWVAFWAFPKIGSMEFGGVLERYSKLPWDLVLFFITPKDYYCQGFGVQTRYL